MPVGDRIQQEIQKADCDNSARIPVCNLFEKDVVFLRFVHEPDGTVPHRAYGPQAQEIPWYSVNVITKPRYDYE